VTCSHGRNRRHFNLRRDEDLALKIAIIGLGYVGVTNAAGLAKLGHTIVGADVNGAKVEQLATGRSPIFEPQVAELIAENFARGHISATTSTAEALADADIAMVCVGTPSKPDGALEDKFVRRVLQEIAAERRRTSRVVPVYVRSTCLPGIHREMMDILREAIGETQPLAYCVHPEFLREGEAVADFFEPPKIVYGPSDAAARAAINSLYPGIDAPIEILAPAEAALVKYADNCYHAVKVTFANEIALLASSFGVDSREVMRVFCLDTKLNISTRYLRPGLPFGGSCLLKDLRAVTSWSSDKRIPLTMLQQVLSSNQRQIEAIIDRVAGLRPRRVALLGITFKDDTDDLRDSPLLVIFEGLRKLGIDIRVFDPLVDRNAFGGLSATSMRTELRERISEQAEELVSTADVTLIARRKLGVDLGSLPWPLNGTVFDLVGVGLPKGPHKVIGLYW
jgi:GDP-mannose 6-dehydrogenase